jgi:hypothetical protein
MGGLVRETRSGRVAVDHSTLKGEPTGTDTRYSVSLIGGNDPSWAAAFRQLQADSSAFRRLRLEPATGVVSFVCRGIDGPTQVFDVLGRLDALVKLVNQHLSGKS